MPPISLLDLPTEVHFEILKNALYSEQIPYYGINYRSALDDEEKAPIRWDWIEQDRRKLSQFPYNAAAVCQLWHDVLTNIPECWTRVIFDVATDPSRFLDIFSWSKDLPKLEVTVFNSHNPDSQDVDHSSLERERVSAIVNALLPHISRCKSISIDIAFVTSLPSPVFFLLKDTPDLQDLILGCTINNAGAPDDYSNACELGVCEPIRTLSSFPDLNNLVLAGFWFMLLSGHPYTSEWFKKIRGERRSFRFYISHFQFQKEGQYSVQKFVEYCSEMKPDPIVLTDLSLNHDGPVLESDEFEYDEDVFTVEEVVFRNVSPDVLRSIFFLADISPRYLTFDNCTFPDAILPTGATELILENIHCPSSADATANLHSILQEFTGNSLFVDSCSAFDDDAFSALQGYEDSALRTLGLSNCGNFTVHGLRQYLERRNRYEVPHGVVVDGPLQYLDVNGFINHCPFPSEEDEEWFESSEYGQQINIYWVVSDPETHATLRRYNNYY